MLRIFFSHIMITSRRKKKGGFIDRKHKKSRKLGCCYWTMLLPKHVPPWDDFRIKRPSKNCIRMSGKLSLKGIYIPNPLNFSTFTRNEFGIWRAEWNCSWCFTYSSNKQVHLTMEGTGVCQSFVYWEIKGQRAPTAWKIGNWVGYGICSRLM